MTLVRAFVSVGVCTVVCAIAGVGLGVTLGHFAPDFYRALLPSRRGARFGLEGQLGVPQPDFEPDPVQLGIGFGLNTGIFTGIVVGLIVVVIVTYYELRCGTVHRAP
jgi:hypothetical protein